MSVGTIDAVAKVKIRGEEKIVVLDWKTSNSLHNEYAMQIAAYAKAYEEVYNVPVHSALIVSTCLFPYLTSLGAAGQKRT